MAAAACHAVHRALGRKFFFPEPAGITLQVLCAGILCCILVWYPLDGRTNAGPIGMRLSPGFLLLCLSAAALVKSAGEARDGAAQAI
ncbi:hypothetical protein BJV77DRAFT_643466 [Russula vinacea]|jgi:hypothetical protein|nr:hypothetical protein BJV77DRAFT_643466 [Russula vinacea]